MLAYTPTYPEAPPAVAAAAESPRVMDTQASLGYAVRLTGITVQDAAGPGEAAVQGLADNVLALRGQFRAGDWLIGGAFWRLKAPLRATVLDDGANPALHPEISEIRASVGRVLGFRLGQAAGVPIDLEVAPGLGLINQESQPGGSGLPLTGTPLDFGQTRRGLGFELPAAVALGDHVEVRVQGALFPDAGGSLTRAPYGFDEGVLQALEGSAGVKVRLIGGLDAELTGTVTRWVGAVAQGGKTARFEDQSSGVTLALVYRPERVGR